MTATIETDSLVAAGTVVGAPRRLLQLEGAILLAGALTAYTTTHEPWWLIPLTLLVPDLFAIGYLAGTRVGANLYNLVHTTPLPAAVIAFAWSQHTPLAGALGPDLARPHRHGPTPRLRPEIRRPLPTHPPQPAPSRSTQATPVLETASGADQHAQRSLVVRAVLGPQLPELP